MLALWCKETDKTKVFAVALVIVVCICGRYGTGYHQYDLRDEWSTHWGKATFCQNLALILSATFTKVCLIRSATVPRYALTINRSQFC